MLFRQFQDAQTSTYTYLLASKKRASAVIIDPVKDHVNLYLEIINTFELKLRYVLDTHMHADHITGSGLLHSYTGCDIVMSVHSKAEGCTVKVRDNEVLSFDDIEITVLYTPGHTDDSCCYLMSDRVFTGDTLLINGTGRTDFQSGNPVQSYQSIFNKLLTLPDETLVYPGHDYNGRMVSTIGEEKRFNPRLQFESADEYARIMNNLNLPAPAMIDVAVAQNMKCGGISQV